MFPVQSLLQCQVVDDCWWNISERQSDKVAVVVVVLKHPSAVVLSLMDHVLSN